MAFTRKDTVTVTSNSALLPSTQADFPVLYSITHADLKTTGNGGYVEDANGYDIRFFSDSGLTSAIPFELEFYDGVNGIVVFWVKIASLALSGIFYVGFGDAALNTNASSDTTWDSDFDAVYHFHDIASPVDATSNNNDLTILGNTANATGKIAGGANTPRDGFSFMDAAASSSLDAPVTANKMTLSFWIKNANTSQAAGYVLNYCTDTWNIIYGFAANTYETYWGGGAIRHTIKSSVSDTNWHKIDAAFDGSADTLRMYYDGVETYNASETGNLSDLSNTGLRFSYGDLGQSLDEFRVSKIARSADWIVASYNSENDPATFLSHSFAAVGGGGGGGTPIIQRILRSNLIWR